MKRLLVKLVKFYQLSISPLKAPCCKYYPTCSNYAIEAIERFGAFKGFFMAIYRILRCNPFSKGGYDPVPESGRQSTVYRMACWFWKSSNCSRAQQFG